MRSASAISVPWPMVIVPTQIFETLRPLRPRRRYSIIDPSPHFPDGKRPESPVIATIPPRPGRHNGPRRYILVGIACSLVPRSPAPRRLGTQGDAARRQPTDAVPRRIYLVVLLMER
jgi:hypothetical protein